MFPSLEDFCWCSLPCRCPVYPWPFSFDHPFLPSAQQSQSSSSQRSSSGSRWLFFIVFLVSILTLYVLIFIFFVTGFMFGLLFFCKILELSHEVIGVRYDFLNIYSYRYKFLPQNHFKFINFQKVFFFNS